jgi:hypothetical protein
MYVQYQSPRPPLVNISNVKASLAIEGETRPIALIARDEAEHDMAGTLLKGQYRNIQIVRKLDLERFPWFKDTRFRVAGGKGRVLAGLLWGIPTLFIQGLENDPEKQAKAVEELSTELHAVKIRDEAAAEAKDVTGKAAILPEDAAPYYLRALRISGFLERAGIARTPAMSAARAVSLLLNSWKETDPLLRDPEWFDQGAADPERSKLIRHAWAAAWLGMADLAGAAIVLTVLSPSLAAWVAVPGIVSLAISLLLHTRYDMHAEVPTAIVIKNRPSDITGVPREKEYATIEIVKELDDESQKGLLHNTGFKVDGNYVWAGMIHDSLTLFVEGVPAERSGQAMDRVIDTLKGFANVQGNGRAIAVLQSLDADFSPVDSAIVYDFTGGMVKVRAGRDEALEFSREELPSYGALRNVLRAHNFALAPEVAIESRWSAGYRKLETLNGSIVLEQKDIENNARVEGIAELRNKGAKIYVKYEGDSQAELEELLKTYRLDGALVVRGNGTDGAEVNSDEIVQNVNSSVDLVLSGPNVKGERGRGYVELDLGNPLDVQRIEDRKIQPGTVVKVKVDDDSIRKIEQLNKLPGNVILVFEGAEYRELSRITGRDIMELNLFGVNLLAALRITPQTDEEKQTYEERMAFALEFGDGVNPGEVLRGDKESLAGTVTHILKGEYAKVENGSLALFIESAAAHDRTAADARSFRAAVAARLVLAAQGKQYGLESAGQEDTLVEMMRKLQELGSDFTVEAPAELVRSGTIKGPEFEQLKARAREGKADAVRAVIELLAVNGDQKVVFRAKDLKFEQLNVNAIRSVLEAA